MNDHRPELIDSHCHFDFAAFADRRRETLQDCARAGLQALLIPGVEPAQWPRLQQLLRDHAASDCRLYAAAGLHPWWVTACSLTPAQLATELADTLAAGDWVAVGECGLDGQIDCPLEQQLPWLEVQLEVARELHKPVILHAHKCHNPLLRLLKRMAPPAGGVIHGFSGSLEMAREYWQLGFYLGVGGTITYPRARKTRDALAAMPLESLLLETDAPDMPLSGYQGQPNSPLQLPRVAACLAELQGVSLAQVAARTSANSRRLFSLTH